jgi:hypothetical protein
MRLERHKAWFMIYLETLDVVLWKTVLACSEEFGSVARQSRQSNEHVLLYSIAIEGDLDSRACSVLGKP